jgi:hypothetical protein
MGGSVAEEVASRYGVALKVLLLLNALDAVFTSWWIAAGWATEANPVMAWVLEYGLAAFICVKLGLGIVVTLVLKPHGHRLIARVGVAAAVLAYSAVAFVHLQASAELYLQRPAIAVASR